MKEHEFRPPLAINIIWHKSDEELVTPILDSIRTSFARDVDRPFSRGLNIPLFFYSSSNGDAPLDKPVQQAARDIVFIFTSVNTLGHDLWVDYINSLSFSDTFKAVPVAMDKESLQHADSGSLERLNFLRVYEWDKKSHAILHIAHEVHRHGFIEIGPDDKGKSSSIKIFLSHAKSGGIDDIGQKYAKAIKKVIDNSNMSSFFDAYSISPGFKFDEEIAKHIKDSTLVAIRSDLYSSRYWCQREVLCAKENDRPIILVDCLKDCEDRLFPPEANVSCLHVSPDTPISDDDIIRVLNAAIFETIRHQHAQKSLEYYQSQNWIDSDCVLFARPPEVRQIIALKKAGKNKVCYPEPPLYAEEGNWINDFGVDAFTPLLNNSEDGALDGLRVGISLSDTSLEEYVHHYLHPGHLKRLSQDLARHLLARSATILYGGDLRPDGFTQFILDEAIALKNRLKTERIHVENHLAWPIYLSDKEEIVAWRAKYRGVIKTVEHGIPHEIADNLDRKKFSLVAKIENKYIWSRCLTEMRDKSIESSDARICAGGKLSGYKGKMPGVLEEIQIAMIKKRPIYLLGAFGGVVGEVCKTILNGSITLPLTEKWQLANNDGYKDLQNKAKESNNHADYQGLKSILENETLSYMASVAGLSSDEYLRLMKSPFIDECVHLILKGLKSIEA